MKKDKRYFTSILYIIIGIVLIGLSFAGKTDNFWNGMGFGLLTVGLVQLLRFYRFNKNDAYRERVQIEEQDERNHFIRNKAWAWAGYLFVIIMAILCIVFKIMGQEILSIAASGSVCLVVVLFWVSFFMLKKKY